MSIRVVNQSKYVEFYGESDGKVPRARGSPKTLVIEEKLSDQILGKMSKWFFGHNSGSNASQKMKSSRAIAAG